MKTMLIASLLFSLQAQEIGDDPARPSLGKSGQVFTLKLTPQSKRLEVSFTDKPFVTLEPDRLVVFGRVFPAKGKPKSLSIRAVGQNLELSEAIDPDATMEFEIKDKVTKKTETIRVKQETKP